MSSELLLVGAAAAHLGTRVVNPYDSDGAHAGVPVSVEQLLLPMMYHNSGEVAVNDVNSGIKGKQYFPHFLRNVNLCQTLCFMIAKLRFEREQRHLSFLIILVNLRFPER